MDRYKDFAVKVAVASMIVVHVAVCGAAVARILGGVVL